MHPPGSDVGVLDGQEDFSGYVTELCQTMKKHPLLQRPSAVKAQARSTEQQIDPTAHGDASGCHGVERG
jgi:hypothetical protein